MNFWKPIYLAIFFLASPAFAESWQQIPSTPDITVAASSTVEVVLPSKVRFVAVKNDCSSDLYFRFTGKSMEKQSETALGLGDNYPVRLKADQSFSLPIVTHNVGASNSGASTCTFTLFLGK